MQGGVDRELGARLVGVAGVGRRDVGDLEVRRHRGHVDAGVVDVVCLDALGHLAVEVHVGLDIAGAVLGPLGHGQQRRVEVAGDRGSVERGGVALCPQLDTAGGALARTV